MSQVPLGYWRSANVITASTLLQLLAGATVPATALPTGANPSNPANYFCYIQPEGQPVRWRDDGTAPTAQVGQLLAVGATLIITSDQFAGFQVIQTTPNAVLNLSFYKS